MYLPGRFPFNNGSVRCSGRPGFVSLMFFCCRYSVYIKYNSLSWYNKRRWRFLTWRLATTRFCWFWVRGMILCLTCSFRWAPVNRLWQIHWMRGEHVRWTPLNRPQWVHRARGRFIGEQTFTDIYSRYLSKVPELYIECRVFSAAKYHHYIWRTKVYSLLKHHCMAWLVACTLQPALHSLTRKLCYQMSRTRTSSIDMDIQCLAIVEGGHIKSENKWK